MDRNINIAFICDDNYAMPTMVTIGSIIKNMNATKVNKILIHIITAGLKQDNINILKKMSNEFAEINIYEKDINEFASKIRKIQEHSHVTTSALFKFELSNILSKLNEVLYLDSDVIVNRDISPLLDIDISTVYAAVVPELWKVLGESNGKVLYFNSGVMFINLELWRKNKISELLWEEKMRLSLDSRYKTMDQDALNNVLSNKIIHLPVEYNFNPYFKNNKYLELIQKYTSRNVVNIDDFMNNVRIVHYVGKEDKPWLYSTARMGELWERYYNFCGYSIDSLSRKKIKKDIIYYFRIFKNMVKDKGLQQIIVYVVHKYRRINKNHINERFECDRQNGKSKKRFF